MNLSKYNFGFHEGKFITIRKWSWWQWAIGRVRRYCPTCDSKEYHTDGDMSILGPSCARCGRNEEMERIIKEAIK